jgi:hypothetical protein
VSCLRSGYALPPSAHACEPSHPDCRWSLILIVARQRARAYRPRRPKPVRPEPREAQIHEAVAGHLRARARPGIHWHHPATGELRDSGTARKLQRMGVRPGLPDFLLLIDARLYGLELKRDRGGRVSADQAAMHAELIDAGAVVAVARGLDQALAILTDWGALGPVERRTS